MQQRAAERLLQPSDLLARGRLGAVNALAGAGKAARIDDRDKAAEQIEIEHIAHFIRGSTGEYFII